MTFTIDEIRTALAAVEAGFINLQRRLEFREDAANVIRQLEDQDAANQRDALARRTPNLSYSSDVAPDGENGE